MSNKMMTMTMAEKAKTRAHMRGNGIDPRDVSAREFVEYARKHRIMDEADLKRDLTAPVDADPIPDPMKDADPLDSFTDPGGDEAEGEGDGDTSDEAEGEGDGDTSDEAEGEGDGDTSDDADTDSEGDDEGEAPEPPPEPTNPIEEMIDARIAAHMASHVHDDTHRLQTKASRKAIAKLRADIKKIATTGPAPVEKPTREKRAKKTVEFKHTHKRFDAIAKCVEIGHNVYLHGPAGSGKTTIGKQIAEVFELDFYMTGRVDDVFTLTGYRDASGAYVETDFYKAFTNGGVFLGDEMDRWAPEALTGINAALANGYMAFPNGRHKAHADFIFLAAGNTHGRGHDRVYTAAQALDAATMDRFTKIELTYDEALERKLALAANPEAGAWVDYVQKARANAAKHRMDALITPRTSITGAELLAAGFPTAAVKGMTFANGLTKNELNQLEQ